MSRKMINCGLNF